MNGASGQRRRRDGGTVALETWESLMPITLEGVKACATEREIVKALVQVFRHHRKTSVFLSPLSWPS